jgi:pilus assembly protein Flp/PilA
MSRILRAFFAARSGATAIEYALIGTIISVAIIFAAIAVGGQLDTMFTGFSSHF